MPKPEPAAKSGDKRAGSPGLKKEEEPETEENHTGRILRKCVKRECRVLRLQRHLGWDSERVNLVLGLYKGDTDS